MSNPVAFGIFEIAFGLLLIVHCPRAAVREYRAGVAVGRYGRYPRSTRPVEFWSVVGLTALAGLLGLGSVVAGAVTAIWGGW